MQTLTVQYPQEPLELLPAPRSQIKVMRGYFVELQSYWVESVFSVGDVAGDDRAWELMDKIAFMLPQSKNPTVYGFKPELLSNDYEQLETLFFCQGNAVDIEQIQQPYSVVQFDWDRFIGCKILNLHRLNPRRVLEDAYALWLERGKAKAEPITEELISKDDESHVGQTVTLRSKKQAE